MGTQFLRDYQLDAVNEMFSGCILAGGVGSGKSRTGLYYYFKENGGSMIPIFKPMKKPQDLYIITTAMKRDSLEWEEELLPYHLYAEPGEENYYKNKVVIDSWNNIKKYADVQNAFFIFDEDRVQGSGAWVKAFLKIAKANKWIILSATSGDCWMDYVPVFIANGFYKNRTEFIREHVIYSRYTKYPKIDRYLNTGRLIRLRNKILVDMDFIRDTVPHHEDIYVPYDISTYKDVIRNRWDIYKDEPIQQAAGLCYVLRRVVNTDERRAMTVLEILEKSPRVIIFYNFDYELDILMNIAYGEAVEVAQWNGHKHQPVPDTKSWVYLVQYTAGCEGWNCIKTDTIIFYSQNYSYKVMEQASGRIDRLNTPYKDLYYYHLKSRSGIDLAISKALTKKKKFNERGYTDKMFKPRSSTTNSKLSIKDRIELLQRKIILNSIAYYKYNKSPMSDKAYDEMCKKLVDMQKKYPNIKDTMYGYVFYDFDGTTGFDLFDRLTSKDKEYLNNIAGHALFD